MRVAGTNAPRCRSYEQDRTRCDNQTPMNTSAVRLPDLKLARCPTCSSLPSRLYLDHSHCPVLAPATLAALPSTRAIETRSLPTSLAATHRGFAFYVALPKSSIPSIATCSMLMIPSAPFAPSAFSAFSRARPPILVKCMHHNRLTMDELKLD